MAYLSTSASGMASQEFAVFGGEDGRTLFILARTLRYSVRFAPAFGVAPGRDNAEN
jgi:hypothetical protein